MIEFTDPLILFVTVIVITVLLFLALRGLNLWYWKINESLQYQKKTVLLLEKILNYQTTGKTYGDLQGELIVEDSTDGKTKEITNEQWEKLPESRKKTLTILKK
jgi:predicted HNH restriction endonuclease